jgi:hypothetical protein
MKVFLIFVLLNTDAKLQYYVLINLFFPYEIVGFPLKVA